MFSARIRSLCIVRTQVKWYRDFPVQEKSAHKTEKMVNFD